MSNSMQCFNCVHGEVVYSKYYKARVLGCSQTPCKYERRKKNAGNRRVRRQATESNMG